MSELLSMGGYGGYVWASFGLTVAVLLGLLVQSLRLSRRRERELGELRGRLREARPRPAPRLVVERDGVAGDGARSSA